MCVKYQKDSKIEQIRKGKKKVCCFFCCEICFFCFCSGVARKVTLGKKHIQENVSQFLSMVQSSGEMIPAVGMKHTHTHIYIHYYYIYRYICENVIDKNRWKWDGEWWNSTHPLRWLLWGYVWRNRSCVTVESTYPQVIKRDWLQETLN